MGVRERDPRTSFWGKLCVAPWAWLVGRWRRSLASLSGRRVVRYRCGHRYSLYWREPLRLFALTQLIRGRADTFAFEQGAARIHGVQDADDDGVVALDRDAFQAVVAI